MAQTVTSDAPPTVAASPVVGRFAPSPSGRMHVGNIASSLVAWLSAKSRGGKIVLRIEDLDLRTRNPENISALLHDLEWLGLEWDEGPFYQSERDDAYLEAFTRLEKLGLTYPCFCSRQELHAASAPHREDGTFIYQGTCKGLTEQEIERKSLARNPSYRLAVPGIEDEAGHISFSDMAAGPYEERLARDCGDFIVRRSDGVYAYQLAVVVDDEAMGVTEVVRGNDLLSSSPRQRYIQHLLGYRELEYGHIPLLVAPDGRRLSKRNQDLDLGYLRAAGVGPERIIGNLAYMLGLADAAEDARPTDLTTSFSWDKLAACGEKIVVNREFCERS